MDYRHGGRDGSVDRLQALTSLAARQHSVFSRSQATAAGVTVRMIDRRLASGQWLGVHRGVYRLVGAPVTWHQRVMAACLAAGTGAAASHVTSAALWGIDGFGRDRVEVSVPGPMHLVASAKVHRSRRMAPGEVTEVDGIPVTTVARTLIDLASAASDDNLEATLDWALREQRTTVSHLRRRLATLGSQGRAGTRRLQTLLDDRACGGVFESRYETRLAQTLGAAGLPEPVRQFRLYDRAGVFVARFDLALPDARIAFEYDSYRHHFGRRAWRNDVGRYNRAAAEGWLVFVFTADDLADPSYPLAASALRAYRARGAA